MSADLDYVVDAALDTEVALVIHRRGIAGEVDALNGVPVRLVAGRVAEDGTHLGRPGMANDQEATLASRNGIAVLIHHIGLDCGEWTCCAAWFQRQNGRRRNHDRASLGLPPGIHDGQLVVPDILAIPHPGFGVDRLTHRSEEAQAERSCLAGHSSPKRIRPRMAVGSVVEDRHLILLDDAPQRSGAG